METFDGGCICGALRYRIEGTPLWSGICHCRSCRRAAGAGSVAWATVAKARFTLTGTLATFASSPGITRGFCSTCGTSLTYDDGETTIDVTLASFDDPDAVVPTRETWLEDRISWVAVDGTHSLHPRGSG